MSMLDPRALRSAFGSFMTGVAVVTTRDRLGEPVGFTANSFASVSLDPPLLLVCPGKFLSSFGAFQACDAFAVSILGEGQEAVSNTFASYKGDRFAKVPHRFDARGMPLITGAIAQFSCTTHHAVPAGDHMILVGEVQDFTHRSGQGLGYAGGNYFSLGLERAALEAHADTALCGAIIEHRGTVFLEHTPNGYRPPQITCQDRGRMRQDLMDDIAGRGIVAELGPAYSVFDDLRSRTQYTYVLAQGTAPHPGALCAIDVHDLPSLGYVTPAIGDMMIRYAIEARTRSFGLYLGDTQRGDVHSLIKRT